MKRIILSLAIVIAVGAIAGYATYSYFSDTQTAAGNTLAAGTLTLTTNDTAGVTRAYSVSNLAPGAWDAAGQVELKNTGTIKGHAWFEVKNIVQTKILGDFIFPKFELNAPPYGIQYGPNSSLNAYDSLKVDVKDLNPGETVPIFLYANWPPTSHDNDGQGGTATFDVVYHLDQIH